MSFFADAKKTAVRMVNIPIIDMISVGSLKTVMPKIVAIRGSTEAKIIAFEAFNFDKPIV